jgi:transcriptional regulator with XRE-family HTH domain
MPCRRRSSGRRTALQVGADRRAGELARTLGLALREARRRTASSQARLADQAGLGQTTISKLERGDGPDVSLLAWIRACRAAGTDLRAYLERASAADQPRDAVHLRHQELVARTATDGGWRPMPEAIVDTDPTRSRAADLILRRGDEIVLVEIWDWLEDVGGAFRSLDRRLAALERQMTARGHTDARVTGLWILRATRRNRSLVADHGTLFRARFAGSATISLKALRSRDTAMPTERALIWVSVTGERMWPARP